MGSLTLDRFNKYISKSYLHTKSEKVHFTDCVKTSSIAYTIIPKTELLCTTRIRVYFWGNCNESWIKRNEYLQQ